MRIITHRALVQNWIKPEEIQSPHTLVSGSFNPYEPNGHQDLDYYYGRKANYFWKTIAVSLNHPEDYFFDTLNGLDRKRHEMNNRFCCLDVIDSIEFCCGNENHLKNYIDNEIFKNFSDNKIWFQSTGKGANKIFLKRNYNTSICEYLRKSDSITKVINTMGKNRISNFNSIDPIESKNEPIGFKKFIQEIISICNQKNIEFDFQSLSPSQMAVNKKHTCKVQLRNWLTESLHL